MRKNMPRWIVAASLLALPFAASAQVLCPPEVQAARQALGLAKTNVPGRTLAGARSEQEAPRGQSVQAPREEPMQAPRGQSVQAPREEPAQAPRGQSVQAPRDESQQAPRGQSVQAPRDESQQAPRGQSVQAPRDLPQQAPRGQSVQAPREEPLQAPRSADGSTTRGDGTGAASPGGPGTIERAERLVQDAEAACAVNDFPRASASAKAALELLKAPR